MRRFIWASSYLAGSIAAGCVSAFVLIQSAGIEHLEQGTPWLSRTAALRQPDAVYVRAHYLLEGRLPPAPGQVMEATAETDSDNRPLTGSCMYRLTSSGPLAPWWSISIAGGSSAEAPLQSTADSNSVVHEPDGSVTIIAYPSPRAGNWLTSPTRRRFTLLYSALPQPGTSPSPPFVIKREACL